MEVLAAIESDDLEENNEEPEWGSRNHSQVGRVSGSVTRHLMPRFVGLRRKQTHLTQPKLNLL